MAVTVVIGRAGSGKTGRCLEGVLHAIESDPLGPAILWIVPKQATFITERELSARTGGFCRASIISFDSLGEMILGECGGAAVPLVTALGRQMILGHLLRENAEKLRYFAAAARQAGLAARLDATFAEFERCGRTSEDLGTLLADLQRAAAPELQAMSDKVHDLKLIYDAYSAYLGQDRLDRQQRLKHVLSCIGRSKRLAGATVYVDGFRQFTEYERHVLAELGKTCESVEINLMIDPASPLLANPHLNPDEMSLFHSVEQTYRRLRATMDERGVAVDGPLVLREVGRFEKPGLRLVEKDLLRRVPIHRDEEAGCIEMIEAPDRRLEVDAVARRIRELWREGVRLREICVLARDIDDYQEMILASFAEHGIAFFVDRPRPVAHHALVQFLRSAIAVALGEWAHEAVMALLKSGLAGITDAEADELENYVLEHRIRGAQAWVREEPWEFKPRTAVTEEGDVALGGSPGDVDQLRRRVVANLGPFVGQMAQKGQTIRSIALEALALFDRFGVRETIARWMKEAQDLGDFERREEHAQVWAELVGMIDQMVDLLGDEPATLEDFSQILESGLERFDLAIAPPTLDQVLVGQVDRTYTPRIRACFVLGLNEGVFPHAVREDTVLSDSERRELAMRKLEVDPDTQRRVLDEDLLAYLAFTRASEKLILSRSTADGEGRPLGPSRYWDRLQEMLPQLKGRVRKVESADPLDAIGTPRQLVTSLMAWVRGLESAPSAGPWASLYQWLSSHPAADDAIDVMRFRSWKALSYVNQASISADIARQLNEAAYISVTQIEAFAACPFKHFSRYALGLRPRLEADEVTPMDLGNVLHKVLEEIVREMIRKRQNWPDVSPEERQQLIRQLAGDIADELRGQVLLSNARNRYLLGRIERALEEVTAAQEAAAKRGSFLPAHAEVRFGNGAEIPALEIRTPKGRIVRLEGKIDRVDIAADEAAVAVIDYKLSGRSLALDEVYHGLSLQLLTYLLVLGEGRGILEGKKLSPAAAFYVKLIRGLEDVNHPSEATPEEKRDLRVKPRGLLDAGFLPAIDKSCGGQSDVVQAYLKKDGTCGNLDRTDVATSEQLAALMEHVRSTIAGVADQMVDGKIDIQPYLMDRVSPCPYCDFRALCRFDVMVNRYLPLDSYRREEVLERVVKEHG